MHYIILFLILGVVLAGAWNFILEIKLRGVLLIASIVLGYWAIFKLVDDGPTWAVWIVMVLLLALLAVVVLSSIYLIVKNWNTIIKTIW